ncbi:MAG: hypothetical protein ACJAR1_002710, partial [Rubritalea sp.]
PFSSISAPPKNLFLYLLGSDPASHLLKGERFQSLRLQS